MRQLDGTPRGVVLALILASTAPLSYSAELTLVRSDDEQILVEAEFDAPLTACVDAGCASVDLTVGELPRTRVPGRPAWPFRATLVAIPPDARYRLEVVDPLPTALPGLAPAPYTLPTDVRVATDVPREGPPRPVEIEFDGYLRERRVLKLRFHPLTPDPAGGGTVYHPRLTARLRLQRAADEPPTDETVAAAPRGAIARLERALYERTILNETSIDDSAYRVPAAAPAPRPTATHAGSAASSNVPAVKIPVDDEGIWTLTHADLLAAGIDAGGSANADISLSAGGESVPRRIVDGGDGTFDPGDRIEFYGVGIEGQLEYDTNVYRLAFGETSGQPLDTRGAAPSGGSAPPSFDDTARFEDNLVFFTTHADSDGDAIGWERLVGDGGGNASASYAFELPDIDPAATGIVLRARLYDLGGSHATSILLNGIDVMDPRSWGAGDVTHDVATSAANLVPGMNTLTVQLSGSPYNQVVLNWFEVDYPRLYHALDDELSFGAELPPPVAYQVTGFTTPEIVVYDVSDPAAPVRLTGVSISGPPGDHAVAFTDTVGGARRFIARTGAAAPTGSLLVDQPSDLGSPANAADLIVLAHRDFVDEMVPLVNQRLAQGWRVELVDLEDVFDEYAFGRPDPAAIKAFLADAHASWQPPAPAFLLLVGNATLDPLQLLPGSVAPLMPTGRFTAPTLGLAASDNALVTFLGGDPLPDMFVGRIPAKTEAEAADAVAKIVAYDTVAPAPLNRKALFVADDDQLSFEFIQEDLISLYLSDTEIPAERAYLRTSGIAATNQKIRSTIDLGAVVTNYFGHGNIHSWAAENVFVDSVDLPLLSNSDRPTFLSTLNCINGFHAGPRTTSLDSLAEQALLAGNGGAIAVWSPSALALLSDYVDMSEVLYRQLFVDREVTLGVATTTAKVEAYLEAGASEATLDEMHLFGDPTTVLRVDGDLDGLIDFDEDAAALDARDADSDDDGLQDGSEPAPFADTDGDGRIDALDVDSDDDGLPDGLESGVAAPPAATDPAVFAPDTDPQTTTDPRDADTDGGGAPDGAEDRDADGAVDPGETDPQDPADDPLCSTAPPVEIVGLSVGKYGGDAVLSWIDRSDVDPCVLYRVYASDAGPADGAAFEARATTPRAEWPDAAVAPVPALRFYLVTSVSPLTGEGPRGHHGM